MRLTGVLILAQTFLIAVFSSSCMQSSNNGDQPLQPAAPATTCAEDSNVFVGTASSQSWVTSKASSIPVNQLPSEYGTPYQQPLANLSWEDGLYISRDGLNLYATYGSMDSLSATFASASPLDFYLYERGNLLNQDYSNPIPGSTVPWIHFDIAISQRSSTSQAFSCWALMGLKGQYYNNGAAVGILNSSNPSMYDYFAYTNDSATTSSPNGGPKIQLLRNTPVNVFSVGTALPANISGNAYTQDNPHIERVNPNNANQLVLLFDSNQPTGLPSGTTGDIWYTSSSDGGTTWTNPAAMSTIDSTANEQQPHLYYDGALWWLYFTAYNSADSKLAIFRASQTTAGNWNSWGTRELVVSAGTAEAVGEPTLTAHGDLSFVLITKNTQGTATDMYDSDPWFLPHN